MKLNLNWVSRKSNHSISLSILEFHRLTHISSNLFFNEFLLRFHQLLFGAFRWDFIEFWILTMYHRIYT
jgi:hypothetical protein